MNNTVKENNGKKYLLIGGTGNFINSEEDAIDLISLCAENDTNLVLIESSRLKEDFMNLKTKVAGGIIQKLAQYEIKTVVVLNEEITQDRFKEFLNETNSGKTFRAYTNYKEALDWLTKIE